MAASDVDPRSVVALAIEKCLAPPPKKKEEKTNVALAIEKCLAKKKMCMCPLWAWCA